MITRHTSRYLLVAFACILAAYDNNACAIENPIGGDSKQPAMLTADTMIYDEKNQIATAVGHVQVVQGDTILLADRISYNQASDTVHAVGHVSVLEPSGDVLFADDAVLTQSMEKGMVKEFRARLKDNSLFAAREADKLNKNVTRLRDVVYSPCNVCTPKPGESGSAPLWQMQAQDVTIDENEQKVKYRNAFMDLDGYPVLWTPYFSHPTPDAPSQSGLLQPTYYHSSLLGSVVKEPLYVTFAPNMDMTLTPWYIGNENGPMLQGEFRYLSENTSFTGTGGIIDAFARDQFGNITSGTEIRDYIDAHGVAKLSQYWDAGVDAQRASDDTFLTFYGIGWQDMLTSRLYAERIEDRDYAVIQSLAFQGLQPEDIANQSPYILPQANMHVESDPLVANSRVAFDSSALELERQVGDSDQRVSSTVSWNLPYITRNGQVIEAKAQVRGDAYNVEDLTTNTATGATFTGYTGRVMPEVDLNWRYPLINRFGEGDSLMIAPIVELAASPNLQNASNIPNEDSQSAELSDINLFSPDRFAGLDQVESGFRGSYGMRGQLQFADEKYLEWLLGQAYQNNPQSPFPIAQSLDANYSDYIGHLGLRYKWLDVGYSFRADRDSFNLISNQVNTTINYQPFTADVVYTDIKNDPIFGDLKEITGSGSVDVTSNWRWNLSGSEDLGSSVSTTTATTPSTSTVPNLLNPTAGTVGFGTGLLFHNECVNVIFNVSRSYITEQEVKPNTTESVMVVLKNFGSPDATPNPVDNNVGAQSMTTDLTATTPGGAPNVTAAPQQTFDNPTTPAPVTSTQPQP